MKYFFFKQKRERLQDNRLIHRTLREFKIRAETVALAILKHSKEGRLATKKNSPGQDLIPIKLSEKDILDLYDICDFNYAIHREVEELY